MQYTVESVVALVASLRNLADHIEQRGPEVIMGGALSLNIEQDLIEHSDSRGVLAFRVAATSITLESDLQLRGQTYAPLNSAKHKADAEIIRANGVAQANSVIAGGLGGPEGYLRYLAIQAMSEQAKSPNSTTVYVATEAGMPITEASRFNKPAQEPQP